MGLFDQVRCEYRLPNPAHQGLVFQTKDLGSVLDEYVITRRGRLVRTKRGFLAPRPCRVVCPIHQDLRIYDSVEVAPEEREWVEYVFRFTEGRVTRVLIDGYVPGEEDLLLLLLLTTIGLRRAAEVVGPKLWRSAAARQRWTTIATDRRLRGAAPRPPRSPGS